MSMSNNERSSSMQKKGYSIEGTVEQRQVGDAAMQGGSRLLQDWLPLKTKKAYPKIVKCRIYNDDEDDNARVKGWYSVLQCIKSICKRRSDGTKYVARVENEDGEAKDGDARKSTDGQQSQKTDNETQGQDRMGRKGKREKRKRPNMSQRPRLLMILDP